MNKYSAQVQTSLSVNFLCNLYANGAVPRLYYIHFGTYTAGSIPNMGQKFQVFRASDSGTSNATTNGRLLTAGNDSLSSDSTTQLKSDFTVNPSTTGTALFAIVPYFRSMAEWTAKRGKEIVLAGTQGVAIQIATTGMVIPPAFSVCLQFEE